MSAPSDRDALEALRRIDNGRQLPWIMLALTALVCGAGLLAWSSLVAAGEATRTPIRARPSGLPYATWARESIAMLKHRFYNGAGLWRMCVPLRICNVKNQDWGSDSLTYDLYLRWQVARDPSVVPLLTSLAHTAIRWAPGKVGSSDNMMWDAVAEVREYQVTGSRLALAKAKAALARLNAGPSGGFGVGACPAIDYQWPFGRREHGTKTLETDSNYVKAALLLYQATKDRAFLRDAERKYAAIRRYYLSPAVPLYTDTIIDDGAVCRAVPGIFLGSVNGNMIWDGATLAAYTGRTGYLRQAIATARAVSRDLTDSAGVYNDQLADIDVGEPLVEAMYLLATDHLGFARNWLLSNASAAAASVNARHEFGRFYGGPPPMGEVTAWQLNGGVALMTAAAALDPAGRPADSGYWRHAIWVRWNLIMGKSSVPILFTGRAIAIVGTVGDHCCSAGHAWVVVDGRPTISQVGIWQNRSSPARRLADQVLFAWRWPTAGEHTVMIRPATSNPLEGGAYFHMDGYLLVS